jgi:hypothetical protein
LNYHCIVNLTLIIYPFLCPNAQGHAQNIHFPFDIEADTSISVATEMVVQLDLTDQDVTAIAEMIDAEIRSHIPDWAAEESIDNQGDEAAHSETHSSSTGRTHPGERVKYLNWWWNLKLVIVLPMEYQRGTKKMTL